ncbi:ABC transporter substrate-binding protein [Intestinimonas sp. MSJ-38]|uniref:ABC transporter substrate-binding protein n=1 Tax=Intestinimonas sp. MSJ-38 TaxID=2841532 RepID=UPI001C119D1D|nr:ABC transporter substrate-binding protein [Intestinimonas sp. MSJ-38]MBU5431788.1 ABC transporter substrate-binding protein [Intestinimonas sp. MSJ-38]
MKKKLISLTLLAAMLFSLAACSSGNAGSQNDSRSQQESDGGKSGNSDVLKVTVAAQPTSGQVFQFIAEEHGFNKEEGVEVEMAWLSNLSDAASALTAGQVDIISTYGTGGPLIQIANGQDFNSFAGYMIIGETPVYGKPETEWTSLDSFKGKKIGITRGGTPDIVLKGILYDEGYSYTYGGTTVIGDPDDPDMIEFVEYKKNTDVLQAVMKGEVDFGATATGYQIQARDLGLEVKMWPDEYWPNHSCCRMLCTNTYLEKNEEVLYRLLRSYLRAEEYMQDHMDEVVDLVVENLDLTRETAESFVLSPHMKYDTDPYTNSVRTMWEKMADYGYLTEGDIKIDDHMNSDIYKRALESLIEEYPDSQFFKDKMAQFESNNA